MSLFDHMKSANDLTEQIYWKNLTYGATGSGKSWFSAGFKRPLIGLTEQQGLATIQERNPNAVPVQSPKTGKAIIDSVAGIEGFKALLRDPALPDLFDGIVVDSLTEFQRIYKDHFLKKYENHLAKGGKENDFWVFGKVLEQMISLCREIRNAPAHASVVCLERHEKDSKGNTVKTVPDLEGGIRSSIGQFFNSVGFMQLRRRERGYRHEINFRAGIKYETKPMTVFDDVECPEPLYLIHKRFGGDIDEDTLERVRKWRLIDEEKASE